jgi:phage baseplate assembly protein W
MLTLRDILGNDLALVSPTPINVVLTTPIGTPVTVSVSGTETDTSLAPIYLSGTIDWNDGRSVSTFANTAYSNGTLAMSAQRYLSPGYHNIGVYIKNYRSPVSDQVQVNLSVTVIDRGEGVNSVPYLYGPILPKDSGYPNAQQWEFNVDTDLAVLVSSVKMLLETKIGERIMQPGYGTDIHSVLFEPSVPGIELLIQEKLVQALNAWEPRVSLISLSVSRGTDRSISVAVLLESRKTRQQFTVTNTF